MNCCETWHRCPWVVYGAIPWSFLSFSLLLLLLLMLAEYCYCCCWWWWSIWERELCCCECCWRSDVAGVRSEGMVMFVGGIGGGWGAICCCWLLLREAWTFCVWLCVFGLCSSCCGDQFVWRHWLLRRNNHGENAHCFFGLCFYDELTAAFSQKKNTQTTLLYKSNFEAHQSVIQFFLF